MAPTKRRKTYAAYGSLRDEILKAAARLFAEKGVARTRMADIAAAVGIEQANVSYHFPRFELLVTELAQISVRNYVAGSMESLDRGKPDPLSRLERYVRSYFEWSQASPSESSLYMYFYYLSTYLPEVRELQEVSRQNGRERISGLLYAAIEDGQMAQPAGIKVPELARMIQSIIIGESIAFFTAGWPRSASAARECARRAWQTVERILPGQPSKT